MAFQLTHVAFYVVFALACLCGLCPFHLSVAPFRLTATRRRIVYSYACAGIGSAVVCATQVYYFVTSMPALDTTGKSVSTLTIVVMLQSLFSTLRTVLMYALQLRNREHIMRNIRQAHGIFAQMTALRDRICTQQDGSDDHYHDDASGILDATVQQTIAWKCGLLAVQTLVMLESVRLHHVFSAGRPWYNYLCYDLIVFLTDGLTIIFSGVNAAVLIAVLQMLRLLGAELARCMRRVNAMGWADVADGASGKIRMQQYCDISDTVDALNALYGEVLAFCRAMGGLFAPHMLLTLLNSFVSALSQLFYIYLDAVQWVQGWQTNTMAEECTFDVLSLSFYILEIVSIVWLSSQIEREGATLGLNMYEVCVDMDDRLTESISMFSIHVLTEQPAVNVLGMFVVNRALAYGMIGSLISYTTLLIQFDLTDHNDA